MPNKDYFRNCGNCKFWDKNVNFWDKYYHGCKLSKKITYKFYICKSYSKSELNINV
jgi:hypothetical protein